MTLWHLIILFLNFSKPHCNKTSTSEKQKGGRFNDKTNINGDRKPEVVKRNSK